MAKSKSIEEATGIISEAVAESVIFQASELLNTTLDDRSLVGYLVGCAETSYATNPNFRKQINSKADRGNRGRDTLWAYMQNWLSHKLLKANNNPPVMQRILKQSGFSTGRRVFTRM